MSSVPVEFDPVNVAANAAADLPMYRDELASKDPMHSVLTQRDFSCRQNALVSGVNGNLNLALITTLLLAPNILWRNKDLPISTKDIRRLRADMLNWGYCKIDNALSAEQVAVIRQRVWIKPKENDSQAAQRTPSGQNINCCVNKGRCFEID